MAKSVVEGKTSDFWSEVKRIKGGKSTVTASVDGEVDDGCIADLFANKYKTLYRGLTLCHMIRLNSEKFMIQLMLLS